jgi:hypothetical protein
VIVCEERGSCASTIGQCGRVSVEDESQVAGVGGDVDDRAEQVRRRRSAVGVEAVEQPGVAGDRPGQQAAEDRGLRREVVVERGRGGAELQAG